MPLPLLIGLSLAVLASKTLGIGSVCAVSIVLNKNAKVKLKSRPNGLPRPPPGMTRRQLKEAAQAKLNMDVKNHFNFVFCGGSGSGKSTLINALLQREDVDFVEGKAHNMFDSAPTGVWQTTLTTLCYACPEGHRLQYVRLWDTAGLGTHENPSAHYFEEKCLYAFDVLIVVAEKELGEYEYTILEKAQKQKIPAVVVITKAEDKVASKIRKSFNTRNPPLEDYIELVQETTDEARQRVFTCLEKKGLQKTLVFVVSAWKYRDFMMEQEDLDTIDHQETISNHEVCRDAPVGQQVSDQGVNAHTLLDHEAGQQEIVEDNLHAKNVLLSFELNQLLDYIAGAAVYRRS